MRLAVNNTIVVDPFQIRFNDLTASAGSKQRCYGDLLSYAEAGVDEVYNDWKRGELQYRQLNGRFLLAFWNEPDKTWTFVTDRLGAYHVYVVWSGERIVAIGSDLGQLAREHSKREIDTEALLSFLSFGFFLDDQTYFKDIRILLPSSVYRISTTGKVVSHEHYWQWHHKVDKHRSYDDTVEVYHSLFTRAVERCVLPDQTVIPVSGGLDSRSIVAALPHGHPSVQTYSYGYTADSVEIEVARRVAKAAALPFTTHVIGRYLFGRLEEIVLTLHGSQDVTQARQMSVNDWVHDRADAVLTGLWGDVWCDDMGVADRHIADLPQFVFGKFLKRGSQWLLDHGRWPGAASPYHSLDERIRTGLSRLSSIDDVDFRVKAYKTSQWAFRWSNASLRGFETGAVPRVPYYDVDLVDFFCTVPTDFIRDRRIQIDHLKRYAPHLARVLWQQTDTNLYRTKYQRYISLPKRVHRKLIGMLTGVRPTQRNWEVQFMSPQGQRDLEYWLLQRCKKLHELFDPRDIAEIIDQLYKCPDAANGYSVSMLLTVGAWLDVYAA